MIYIRTPRLRLAQRTCAHADAIEVHEQRCRPQRRPCVCRSHVQCSTCTARIRSRPCPVFVAFDGSAWCVFERVAA